MTSRRGTWASNFPSMLTVVAAGVVGLVAIQGCVLFPPTNQGYTATAAAEAKTLIDSHVGDPSFVIIDVRTPQEFASGHIAGAINLNVNGTDPTFADAISGLDKTRTYFVYCGSQHRSPLAIAAMQQAGFTSLYELTGGLIEWNAAGLPLEQ